MKVKTYRDPKLVVISTNFWSFYNVSNVLIACWQIEIYILINCFEKFVEISNFRYKSSCMLILNSKTCVFIRPIKLNSGCTGLDPTWEHAVTDTQFPVEAGKVITVRCKPRYINLGARTITCIDGTNYEVVRTETADPPKCLKTSK